VRIQKPALKKPVEAPDVAEGFRYLPKGVCKSQRLRVPLVRHLAERLSLL